RAIRAAQGGTTPDPAVIFPTIDDGLAGIKFIDAAVKSSAANGAWVRLT
ncbi:MAG: gfo/Idh/MocA family oxidoreductase, partial [Bradyrhizobium sp.]|nr:gfo/Idh/MocA family oxidoreductase [Bradyrhizobium sp.]